MLLDPRGLAMFGERARQNGYVTCSCASGFSVELAVEL